MGTVEVVNPSVVSSYTENFPYFREINRVGEFARAVAVLLAISIDRIPVDLEDLVTANCICPNDYILEQFSPIHFLCLLS